MGKFIAKAVVGEDLDVVLVLVKVSELIAGEVVEQCDEAPMRDVFVDVFAIAG